MLLKISFLYIFTMHRCFWRENVRLVRFRTRGDLVKYAMSFQPLVLLKQQFAQRPAASKSFHDALQTGKWIFVLPHSEEEYPLS